MTTRRPPWLALVLCALLSACGLPGGASAPTPAQLVDDVAAARRLLERERAALRSGGISAERVRRMSALGIWAEADSLLSRGGRPSAELMIAEAELRLLQHRYPEAVALDSAVLRAQPAHRAARLLHARLQVQAWDLAGAAATARALLAERPRDEDAALLLGRVRLLERSYPEALEWAQRVQEWNPGSAGAYLLEADARFWNQDPAGAETPLRRALQLAPLDADARFGYGYALWRRVDATQLGAMAAQWNLALAVDPLHYLTHWHLGNGHTSLTYADYAQPADTLVRARLARADSLIARQNIPAALEVARRVERDFPQSLLPAMLRGSAFYMAYDMDRRTRLDSAQAVFLSILARKPNYGPAHNGVAAVIKQRQLVVLAKYDSLEAEIARTPTPPDPALEAVIPDVRYYPGERVERMVRQQLGPALAYLPLVQRQGRTFRIPPLHRDLAQAMGQVYFRTATTFDNRQWMDVRGVGSGAAGIEYVERGSHQERDVLLHEFVHLVHQTVLTDAEVRRVRELYLAAVREGRTLDYYAANNEHEFLAQAYPAFLSPVKIHPLNHKAMATREELRRRDPATFAFVDSLVTRARRFQAGDSTAFRGNWAQVYVNLAEAARRDRTPERLREAAALLDSALVWDAAYLPAMLGYAALQREEGRFTEAEGWLQRAESLDPGYAPVLAARAELVGARARAEGESPLLTVDRQAGLYRLALRLERDPAERAELYARLRALYLAHARIPEAIRVAEEYAAAAPTLSTYLRDRKDEADAFAHELRAGLGYAAQSLPFFAERVARRPQDYTARGQYADALVIAGREDEALRTLTEALRVLSAGGGAPVGFLTRLAEVRLLAGDTAGARAVVQPILEAEGEVGDLRLVRVLGALGQTTEANVRLSRMERGGDAAERADRAYTLGWMAEWRGDAEGAEQRYREALAADPYHRPARLRLIGLLHRLGREPEAARLEADAATLEIPLGPDFRREAAALRAPSAYTPARSLAPA